MKPRHSDSLLLMWRLAELEARNLKSSTIEPTHLLLGLCKSVDLDLPALLSKGAPDRDEILEELLREVRRLRTVFRAVGLDARQFRRALRHSSEWKLEASRVLLPESRLRRSKAAKQVFADAEHFAQLANSLVFPVHLLYAIATLEDKLRDELMKELGVNRKRLQEVARREALPSPLGEGWPCGHN